MRWPLNLFDSVSSTTPRTVWVSAQQLVHALTRPRTVFRKEDAKLVSFCEYHPGARDRKRESIVRVFAIVGDIDDRFDDAKFAVGIEAIRAAGVFAIAYQTFNSAPAAQRWRVIVFLDRGIDPGDYADCWCGLDRIFDGMLDANAKDAGRISYLPCTPPGQERAALVINGDAYDDARALGAR